MNRDHSSLAGNIASRKLIASKSSSSHLGLELTDIVGGGLAISSKTSTNFSISPDAGLAERVFHALVDAKIWTSNVAMHFSVSDRDRYFRQLDLLHDCDEWIDGQSPILLDSYKGFIRFMLMIQGASKPSLALTPKGHLLAAWQCSNSNSRLSIIFPSGHTAEWVVSQNFMGSAERAAGIGSLARVVGHVAPYGSSKWFLNA